MLTEMYRRMGYASSPATEITTRYTAFLNEAHRRLLTQPGMERLRDDIITFASVASRAIYGLPPSIARVKGIHQRSNMRQLRYLSLDELRREDPGLTSSGTPDFWTPIGYQPVALQPADASEIFVKSTAAGDTGTAYLEGIRTGGYPRTLSVTMTGTTAVSLSAVITDLIAVTKFYLSAAAVGTVTLHEDSGAGTELARIPIGGVFARYHGIQLWPTPSAVETFYVDHTRVIPDLVNGTDEPLLPEDFHWLMVTGALKREYEKKDDSRYRQTVADEADGLRAFRAWHLYGPGYDASVGDGGGSHLGGWYPSGRW